MRILVSKMGVRTGKQERYDLKVVENPFLDLDVLKSAA